MKYHLAIPVVALLLAACATTGQTPQQAMQGYCTVSVPEFAALSTVQDKLSPGAAKLVNAAAPINAAICTPAAIAAATPETVQQYLAQVLPAVTVLGVELASQHNAPASAAGATK